jgi:hypothetical protein
MGIEALLGSIDRARLSGTIKELTSFPTRWTLSPDISRSRDWVATEFINFGYKSQRVRQVEAQLPNGTIFQNVPCAPERRDHGFILICAHHDCTSERLSVEAPGADDNASGVAAMLEPNVGKNHNLVPDARWRAGRYVLRVRPLSWFLPSAGC